MDGRIVTHRYGSYFAMDVGCPMTLYTRRTVGQGVWCRHEALNWSATARYQISGILMKLLYHTAPESVMPIVNLKQ